MRKPQPLAEAAAVKYLFFEMQYKYSDFYEAFYIQRV